MHLDGLSFRFTTLGALSNGYRDGRCGVPASDGTYWTAYERSICSLAESTINWNAWDWNRIDSRLKAAYCRAKADADAAEQQVERLAAEQRKTKLSLEEAKRSAFLASCTAHGPGEVLRSQKDVREHEQVHQRATRRLDGARNVLKAMYRRLGTAQAVRERQFRAHLAREAVARGAAHRLITDYRNTYARAWLAKRPEELGVLMATIDYPPIDPIRSMPESLDDDWGCPHEMALSPCIRRGEDEHGDGDGEAGTSDSPSGVPRQSVGVQQGGRTA